MENIKKIMLEMDEIEYGFRNDNNVNIFDFDKEKWNKEFYKFYYLLSPEELLKRKCGVCWDQVELERMLFSKLNMKYKTYFICTYDDKNFPSHTFLIFELKNKYYWFEHSWHNYKGIHEYDSLKVLLKDVKDKFIKQDNLSKEKTRIYEYEKPKYHISCEEFYKYMETQKKIEVD